MICVSIGRGRHRHMIAEHQHLVEQGAQLVELRLDYIHGEVNVRRLLHNRPCAVIATCRRERDGGKYSGADDSRLMLLRAAIAEGVEYVDLEEDIAGQVPRFGATRRIVSYHDFRKTSDDLAAVEARLRALDADIVKLATMANHPLDNLRMLQLIRSSAGSTVGMCMGDIGLPSRILAGRFGSPITYATFHHERALAPGQLSYAQMTEVYHYDEINAQTDVYGIIGDPIAQCVTPMIFNAALHDKGLNAVHVPFRVPLEGLGDFVDHAPGFGIRGLSIAVPYKEAIAAKLTKIDTAAKGIQSVDTVVLRGADVIGFNTTCRAALDCLDHVLEEENGKPASLSGRLALVLGAGDAAKAVVYGLRSRGARINIASRRRESAEALAKKYRGRAIDWHARHTIAANLLINCTPVGMHPSVDETPFDKHHLKPSMLVLDAVYNPEQTLLVKDARKQSCRVITGVELFVRQVCLQFLPDIENGPRRDRLERRCCGTDPDLPHCCHANMPIALPLPVRLTLLVALGAALGSLINLAVYRLAWHRRAVSPWSTPPPQAPPRRWSDRLPIVGWLGLRREVPVHGTLFWVRPMLTEIATAAGMAWLYWWEVSKLGLVAEQLAARMPPLDAAAVVVPEEILHATLLSHVVLMALMAVASLIDIDEKTIPDAITVPGTIVGLALAVVLPWSLLPQVDVVEQVSEMAMTLALADGRAAIFPPADHVTLRFLTLASPSDWPATLSSGRPGGLALGIGCFWFWCFALAPRPWYGRHGWLRGWQVLLTRLWRALRSGRMILLEVGGTLLIVTTWLVGGPHWAALLTALVGLVGAGGVVWAVRLLGAAALKKEAMGFGDVTLMMMIGTFLGWQTSLVIFFLAPFAGLVIGLLQWIVLRDQLIPYGPFLCLAAVGTTLWWARLWNVAGPAFSVGWLVPAAIIVSLPAMWGMLALWHLVLSLFGWR